MRANVSRCALNAASSAVPPPASVFGSSTFAARTRISVKPSFRTSDFSAFSAFTEVAFLTRNWTSGSSIGSTARYSKEPLPTKKNPSFRSPATTGTCEPLANVSVMWPAVSFAFSTRDGAPESESPS